MSPTSSSSEQTALVVRARLAGVVAGDRLVFTTQADFGRRARLIWAFAQFPHRTVARYLLGRAVRSPNR